MAKPKKKKVEIEENEFLKGLIDEVKAYDENALPDADDGSLVDFENVILTRSAAEDKVSRARGIFEPTRTLYGGSEKPLADNDIPTMFAKLGKDLEGELKVPSLPDLENNLSEDSEEKSSELSSSAMVTALQDEFPQEKATQTSAEKTIATVPDETAHTVGTQGADRTVAVEGARGGRRRQPLQEKVVAGSLKGTRSGQVYTSLDASLAQAETLKVAQERIQELESEVDRLRQENDDLGSASDIVARRMEELQVRVRKLEKEKHEQSEQAKSEMLILKGRLQYKDAELSKSKAKVDDLDMRIKSDFRKIRVRERELENRLELVRAEKQALMRSKDEKILELQRKVDQFKSELDLYRSKVQDLNKSMEEQQEQMRNTVRALRVALSNLEHEEMTNVILGEVEASIGESSSQIQNESNHDFGSDHDSGSDSNGQEDAS